MRIISGPSACRRRAARRRRGVWIALAGGVQVCVREIRSTRLERPTVRVADLEHPRRVRAQSALRSCTRGRADRRAGTRTSWRCRRSTCAATARGQPFEFLQRELGEHGIGAKSITTADGDYGQMLISRWPMTRHRDPRHLLSGARAAPRDRDPDRDAARAAAGGRDASRPAHPRAARRRPRSCSRSPAREPITDHRDRRFQRLVLGRLGAQGAVARAARPHALPHLSVAAARCCGSTASIAGRAARFVDCYIDRQRARASRTICR